MKQEIHAYFERLFKRLRTENKKRPIVSNLKGDKNLILVSDPDDSGWCEWQPVEKSETTLFSSLEDKYGIEFHKDIKDYYNQYWFYEIYGKVFIDAQQRYDIVELERVLPNRELRDLESHIGQYYWGRDLRDFAKVPIGLIQNLFVVVDNKTGEVFLDDRLEQGVFTPIASSIAELISRLEP